MTRKGTDSERGGVRAREPFGRAPTSEPTLLATPLMLAPLADTGVRATIPTERGADEILDGFEPVTERHDTPLVPALPLADAGAARATLTVMSGLDAGLVLTVSGDMQVIGRSETCDIHLDDAGLSRRHARIARAGDGGFYIEDLGSTNGTFVGTRRVATARIVSGDYLQLGASLLVRFAVTDRADETLRREVYESSIRDPLTHTYNRKYLADRIAAECAHARRTRSPLALLMLDLDHFKELNDRFGHVAGDRVVCLVAERVQHIIRAEDTLARYGGEEFVVLARGTPHDEAALLAERLRHAIEDLAFVVDAQTAPVTVSVGVASFDEVDSDQDPSALVALADQRLYAAKLRGRNVVCAGTS